MIGRIIAVVYVGTMAALAAYAFSDRDQDHWTAEIAAAVLGLPLIVPALPVIYVVGAVAWNVSAAMDDAQWPVTLTFAALAAAVGTGNVLLWRRVLR